MTQNGSKWVQKWPKNIFVNFLSNYLFLRIFGDFFRFFGPFSTTFQKSGRFGPEFDPFRPIWANLGQMRNFIQHSFKVLIML